MVERSPKSVIMQDQQLKDLAMEKTERPKQTTFDRPDRDQPTAEAWPSNAIWNQADPVTSLNAVDEAE